MNSLGKIKTCILYFLRETLCCYCPTVLINMTHNCCLGGSNVIKPSVVIKPKHLELYVGEPAEFVCQSPGSPTLEWYRSLDLQFNPSVSDHAFFVAMRVLDNRDNRLMKFQYTSQNGVFRIPAVKESDRGTYFCRATNQIGETDSQICTIDIKGTIEIVF